MRLALTVQTAIDPEAIYDDEDDEGEMQIKQWRIRVKFNFDGVSLRRGEADFGRNYCSGSIGGGVMGNGASAHHCKNLIVGLNSFANYEHNREE